MNRFSAGAMCLATACLLAGCGGGSGSTGVSATPLDVTRAAPETPAQPQSQAQAQSQIQAPSQTEAALSTQKQAQAVTASIDALPLDAYRSFRATAPGATDRFIRHADSLGYTAVVDAGSADLLKKDATFKIVRGLADANCQSIESFNYPGEYLRHAGSRVRKDRRDGSSLFDLDATWCGRPGLSGKGVSLESKNYAGRYLRQFNGELWLARSGGPLSSDAAAGFTDDATWETTMPWSVDTSAATTPSTTPGSGTGTTASASACNAVAWQPNTNYQLGQVVQYPANGRFYKAVNVVANGTDMTDPTISTWYWAPTTCDAPVPPPPPPPAPADPNPCGAVVWQPNTNYQLGNIVKYPANGLYYKVVNVIASGTDKTDPTISTWYWAPTTCSAPTPTNPPPNPPPANPGSGGRFVGGYYPWWVGSPIRIKDIDAHYNLIYLFAATPEGGDVSGRVRFQAPADGNGAWTHWGEDIQYARSVQKRKVMLSVGGAGFGMSFPNRAKSQTFVDSIDSLYVAWGGFDGLDFNTFEGSQSPDTAEMIWIAKELKRRHPGFMVSAPPAPWNKVDQKFCKDMLDAGALDFCAPQYYDGPNLADPAWIAANVDVWMALLGPANVVIGFGIDPQANNYETIDVAERVWAQIKGKYPATRGAFDWQINNDALQGYPFAKRLGPAIVN